MIGCIIQARMGSIRLPGKVMKKLDENYTVLHYVIEQISNSKLIDKIVIATTTLKEDDVIVDLAKKIHVDFFRGDSQDVLDRYYQCAKHFSFSTIVRITSDTPLIDPRITDQVITKFDPSKYDYVCNTQPRTFPQGTETEVFSFSSLEYIWNKATLPSEREHVTPYFYTHSEKFRILNIENSENISHLRWCIDVENDLKLVKIFVNGIKNRPILTNDILQFLKKNPEVFELNKGHIINEGYFKSLKEDEEFQKKQ
jgi:spore coat polysaccharide biosynthesis protein SpsF